MLTCPYCGYKATSTDEEIQHMNSEHPDVVAQRLRDAGMEQTAGGFFLRNVDRRVRIETPPVIPAGAEFSVYVVQERYDDSNIVIKRDDEVMIIITNDGGIVVNPKLMKSWMWARMLLERDPVQGKEVLKRMIDYYEENDSKAWDMGRLRIVLDAQGALAVEGREEEQ